MSEYQYYEFQTLDRPLTDEARAAMHQLSSRVQLTATSASFVYHYGDFRGNPTQILAQYFDMMLYMANWGTRQLMFRLPREAVNETDLKPYLQGEGITLQRIGEGWILDLLFHDEEGGSWDWLEGEGWLGGLVQLRHDILRGDYRALYLRWLKFAQAEYDLLEVGEDLTCPPVPPGLGQLSPALQQFIEFFDLDQDWVTAAAQNSPQAQTEPSTDWRHLLGQLPVEEMQGFLLRLLAGETYLDIALRKRLGDFEPAPTRSVSTPSWTIRQLAEAAQQVHQKRVETEKRQAEQARLKRLEKTAQQEAYLWQQVEQLIPKKQAKAYDEAVKILVDLRDLARHQARLAVFDEKLEAIRATYPRLTGLQQRLKAAKLI